MTQAAITAVGIVRAKSGQEDELGRRMAALIEPTRKERGCIGYDLFRSSENPAVWMFLETWRSQSDLDAHVRSAHLQAFLRSKDEVVEGSPDNSRFFQMQ